MIWDHLYNLKKVEKINGEMLLQENFNKSNTAPSVPNCAKCHMYIDVEKVNSFAHGELINSQQH